MEIAFAKKSLRDLCETERMAQRILGKRVAEKLKHRLADLRAAPCAKDLIAGRPQQLEGNRIVIELGDGFRLVLKANHSVAPLAKGKVVDWARVNRVQVSLVEPNPTP